MIDLDRLLAIPSRPARLAIGFVSLLVVMFGSAAALGASSSVGAAIGIGKAAKKEFGVVLGSHAASRLEGRGLARRHLAHQRRPANVAAALTAMRAGVDAAEEGLAPVVDALSPLLPSLPPLGPAPVVPAEPTPAPEDPPAPPVEAPTPPEEAPVPPEEPPAPPEVEEPAPPPPPEEPPPPPVEPPAPPEEPPPPPPEEPAPPKAEEPPVEPPTEPPPPGPKPPPEPEPAEEPLLNAGFENGLAGWSTAGVGEVMPKVATDIVRDGDKASKILLTGDQNRSELILGGNGSGSLDGMVEFKEGDEYWYGFSFYIQTMVYGRPGAHNLIMQLYSAGSGPNFGLQLWDYAGDDGVSGGKGLWSHGGSMGGDRFLSPVSEDQWHDVRIHFKASSRNDGFYEVFLDGGLVDSRNDVSMIIPGSSLAYIKDGLYRNGDEIPGTSDIRLDAAKLGETMESVLP
jgi:hypothetical protein